MHTSIARLSAIFAIISLTVAPLSAAATSSGANGQILFNYVHNGINSVAAANPDGTESHIIAQGTATLSMSSAHASTLGTKITYVKVDSTSTPSTSSIMVANANGTQPTAVVTMTNNISSSVNALNPVFSSDGATIYFYEQGNNATTLDGIYSVATSGGTASLLVATTNPSVFPSFSPYNPIVTSTNIFFSAFNQTNNTTIVNNVEKTDLTGGSKSVVYTASNVALHPSVFDISPDGSQLLVDGAGTTNTNAFEVATATGAVIRNLTNDAYNISSASYSPDGTKVIYSESNNGSFIANVDGTAKSAFRTYVGGPSSLAWTTIPFASAGTYPMPLADSLTSATGGGTGGITVTTILTSDIQPNKAEIVSANTHLIVDGTRGNIIVQSGGVLGGHNGTVGTVSVQSGGTLAPGGTPGCINSGNLTLASGSNFNVDVAGSTVCTEYSQQNVTGTVDLGGSTLNVALIYTPATGTKFIIINNDGSDAVTNTFNGLAEGATVTANGQDFTISYIGGDGNDVVLTSVGAATIPALPVAALFRSTLPIALAIVALLAVIGIEAGRRVRFRR